MNKSVTKCKLKLHLPLKIINDVYTDLKKPFEMSGVINFDNNDTVTNTKKNKGNADSVTTPNNVINYHTHPISAYNEGKTVWGWPSGEDIRESIKFALAGNKAHLVFTVEGLYTIQISPCKIKKIKELLNSQERGVLIFLIEEYFKTTHNFRGIQEVNNLAKRKTFINPYSYVDFANTFDLSNLMSTKTIYHRESFNKKINEIGHTGIYSKNGNNETFGKIPNIGFASTEDDIIKTSPIKDYIIKEDLHDMRSIDANGGDNESNTTNNVKGVLLKLKTLLKKFKTNKCDTPWNNHPNAWFFVNFFPSAHYLSKEHSSGNKFIGPKKSNNYLPTEPFIRVFSNVKDGCSVNKIATINNFTISSHRDDHRSENSFGVSELTPEQRYSMYSIMFNVNLETLLSKMKNEYPSVTLAQVKNEIEWLKQHIHLLR